jgi:lipopolysaccharide biosynthesis regulator YciM
MDLTLAFWIGLVVIAIIAGTVFYQDILRFVKRNQEVDEIYVQALESLLDGELRLGTERLKKAIRENTENIAAYIRLGNIMREHGSVNTAIKIHAELHMRKSLPQQYANRLNKALADDYIKAGNYEKSLYHLNLIDLSKYPISINLNNYKRQLLEKLGRWEDAFQLLKNSHSQDEKSRKKLAHYKVKMAEKKVEEGEEKEARIIYKEALKFVDHYPTALLGLGDSYWRENRKDEAIQKWQSLCQNNPKHAYLAFEKLEKAWFEIGEFEKTQQFYQMMLREYSEIIEPYLALATILEKKGEFEKALEILDKGLRIDSENKQLLGHKVKILIKAEKNNEAASLGLQLLRTEIFSLEKQYTSSMN